MPLSPNSFHPTSYKAWSAKRDSALSIIIGLLNLTFGTIYKKLAGALKLVLGIWTFSQDVSGDLRDVRQDWTKHCVILNDGLTWAIESRLAFSYVWYDTFNNKFTKEVLYDQHSPWYYNILDHGIDMFQLAYGY